MKTRKHARRAARRRTQPSRADGGGERARAHDRHHALQIVGQDAQAHLGFDVFKPSRQEVGVSHPGFERAEGVFDGASPSGHRVRLHL